MNDLALSFISAIIIGLGATLTTDLWALFLKRAFKIAAPNYCLVGRWLRYMSAGIFRHSNIASAPQKSSECTVGWIAHYMIGVTFAVAFVALAGSNWLQHPTLISMITLGGNCSASAYHHQSCQCIKTSNRRNIFRLLLVGLDN